MSARTAAVLAAAAGVVLTLAQDVAPGWPGYHTWQYAAALAIAVTAVVGYVLEARRGSDGEIGRRLVLAMLGALVITAAGLLSGLLGPDTETVARAPGTVAPLPAVPGAAVFPVANPPDIVAGDASVTLRLRDGRSIEIAPGSGRFAGATALRLVPQTAAYVEARDPRGNHLTITQPTNPSFLSPVLLFTQSVPLAGKVVPSDSFAVPALHRQIKAFYFTKGALGAQHLGSLGADAAVLFAVDDDAGRLIPGAIGFAPSGRETPLGGLQLTATLGTYPALQTSAVPYPPALWFGAALCLIGIVYAVRWRVPPQAVDVVSGGRLRSSRTGDELRSKEI